MRNEKGEIYTINYLELIPLLLKHIQELEMRNQEFDLRFDIQQQEIENLKKLVTQLILLAKG